MKKGLTEIVCILDRSGSMSGLEDDTIGGYNATLDRQRDGEGEVLVSTVLFDSNTEVLHDRVPLNELKPMTRNDYRVGGCTALLDAVGGAIHHIGNVHKYARNEDVPEKTLFVITTDGMENASHIYSFDRVRSMIERQKTKYGWEFLFLGADMNSVTAARRMGVDEDRAVAYENDAMGNAIKYRAVSEAMASLRCMGSIRGDWADEVRSDFASRHRK